MRDGVELVIVASRTADRQAEPNGAGGVNPVFGVHHEDFLGDGAAFACGDVAAVESGGDLLFLGGVGKQVAGNLLDGELVEGLIAVEGADDPVAVGPHLAVIVVVQAVGIGVAGGVEPIACTVLAVGLAAHQGVDEIAVGIGR